MIKRQRTILNRTFAQTEESKPDGETLRRLAKSEKELSELTAQFTAALEERFGPQACLHEAVDNMQAATMKLSGLEPLPARDLETAALAGLVKARQNIRKLLSRSNSQASECRTIDRQERQKLRLPETKSEEERLAKLQQEIEQLAREQRTFSEEMARESSPPAAQQSDSKSRPTAVRRPKGQGAEATGNTGTKSASAAERQAQAAEKARSLNQQVRKEEALSDLARDRMDRAASGVQESSRLASEAKRGESGQHARAAAEELERLARQIEGLRVKDVVQQIMKLQQQCQKLAQEQQDLARDLDSRGEKGATNTKNAGGGREKAQHELAEDGKTLADLFRQAQFNADGVDPKLGRELRELGRAHSPQTRAEEMQRAEELLKNGRPEQARLEGQRAGTALAALARALDALRRSAIQPQLDQLMAAEKQAAELQQALQAADNSEKKSKVEKQLTELRERLRQIQHGDDKLAEAARALEADQERAGNTTQWGGRTPRGFYEPPESYVTGVRRATAALQARIQEIILKEILLDRDEPVPPQYRKLVDEYYKVLSEDLR